MHSIIATTRKYVLKHLYKSNTNLIDVHKCVVD